MPGYTTAPAECLIALGSNLGDRLAHLRFALAALRNARDITVVSVSGLYETAPVGGPDRQGAYFNAALLARSALSADNLLAFLHRLEAERQRKREVRWGPRTLDLDLLTYGEAIGDEDRLILPHPRMHERRFVMVPVCDVAPTFVHPRLGRTMEQILLQLPGEPENLKSVCRTWWSHKTEGHEP